MLYDFGRYSRFFDEEDVEDDEGWDEEGDYWQQQLTLVSSWGKNPLFACSLPIIFVYCKFKSRKFDIIKAT